jgi:hypothetical protein
MNPPKRLYIGIDESNHGRFPEVFVATLSYSSKDIYKGKFSKKRSRINPSRLIGDRGVVVY